MPSNDSYLARKRREIALLNGCLAEPIALSEPRSTSVAAEQKFKLAAALRAERSLQSWSVTETARPPTKRWRSGAFEFSFGYQRADLTVRGPPIYPSLAIRPGKWPQTTVYTGSGMSAIAALLTASTQLCEGIEIFAARDCYGETRELMKCLGPRISVVSINRLRASVTRPRASHRVLWLDSCVRAPLVDVSAASLAAVDLVVLDTTCYWQASGRIARVTHRTLQAGVPLALVRSHAKLDCLGIEYGRLGSVVIATSDRDASTDRGRFGRDLALHASEAVRLFGAAPIPAHFPPFGGNAEYRRCSAERTASIIRSTRRLARMLRHRLRDSSALTTFQHGLYLTLAPRGDLRIDDVKQAAGELAAALGAGSLPVRHAGSFGFDFVAVEWSYDPLLRRNVIRISGADVPPEATDRVAAGIAQWWSSQKGLPKPASETTGAGLGEARA